MYNNLNIISIIVFIVHVNDDKKKILEKKEVKRASIKAQEIGLENFVEQKNKNLNNKNKNLASFTTIPLPTFFRFNKN